MRKGVKSESQKGNGFNFLFQETFLEDREALRALMELAKVRNGATITY